MKEVTSYLLFEIEKQLFAIDVLSIVKVHEISEITPIPSSPKRLHGIIDIGDQSYPLIDIKQVFNFKNTKESLDLAILSTLKLKNEVLNFAIAVDDVKDIIHVDDNEIKEVPKLHYNINLDYLEGLIKLDEKLVFILKIQSVLGLGEKQELVEIMDNRE
ncbi:MAG: chemotaxis protein CheW [Bacteroidales bacterium]|nr:chemotaxis protein CheW [Bacteroidales bacterium]